MGYSVVLRLLVLTVWVECAMCAEKERPVDFYGDPLPSGAMARIGTLRWQTGDAGYSISFSPDMRLLATTGACEPNAICLWDTATGRMVRQVRGHTDLIKHQRFLTDGKTLVSGSADGTVRFWDVETGKELRRVDIVASVKAFCLSPDGGLLVVATGQDVLAWDLNRNRLRYRIIPGRSPWPGVPTTVNAFVGSQDGRYWATGFNTGKITIRDMERGKKRFSVKYRGVPGALAYSADSQILAVADIGDEGVHVWDLMKGQAGRLRVRRSRELRGDRCLSLSRDGKLLATMHGGQVLIYDTRTWRIMRELRPAESLRWTCNAATCLQFSPDGKQIAAVDGNGVIRIWQIGNGRHLNVVPGPHGGTWGVRFLHRGRTVLCEGAGYLRGWSVENGRQIPLWPGVESDMSVPARYQGPFVVTFGRHKKVLNIWDPESGRQVSSLEYRNAYFAISADGRLFADGGGGLLRVLDLHRKTSMFSCDLANLGDVVSLTFSWDGQLLAAAISQIGNDQIRVYSVNTGQLVRTLPARWPESLVFTPDGKTLFSTGCSRPEEGNAEIWAWDVASGELRQVMTGHNQPIEGLDVSPDGKLLASASWDGSVRLWDVNTGDCVAKLTGHRGVVRCVSFSDDGRLLASSGKVAILVWDVGQVICDRRGKTQK